MLKFRRHYRASDISPSVGTYEEGAAVKYGMARHARTLRTHTHTRTHVCGCGCSSAGEERSQIKITHVYGITQDLTALASEDEPLRGTLGLTEFRHSSRAPSKERGTSVTTL